MRALLLAAGRGERMRPLTDTVPKPLLRIAGRALIDWQIDALVRAGVRDIVMDYVKPAGIRLLVHVASALALLMYAIWSVQILWGM
jgi:NDP-sugar pyrophosphorylase family protein